MSFLESLLTKENIGLGVSALSLLISLSSFVVAVVAIWLVHFRLGTVRMTLPSLVYFGFDGHQPKIMLRTLLHCSSARGRAVEGLYLKIRYNESSYIFVLHGYTERTVKEMLIGSSMFVGQSGVSSNFHYVFQSGQSPYTASSGVCKIEAFAKFPDHKKAISLTRFSVRVTAEDANAITNYGDGALFRWRPDRSGYERVGRDEA